jgi:hypothetical protein
MICRAITPTFDSIHIKLITEQPYMLKCGKISASLPVYVSTYIYVIQDQFKAQVNIDGIYIPIKIDQSISRKQECFGFMAALIPTSAPKSHNEKAFIGNPKTKTQPSASFMVSTQFS